MVEVANLTLMLVGIWFCVPARYTSHARNGVVCRINDQGLYCGRSSSHHRREEVPGSVRRMVYQDILDYPRRLCPPG